MAMRGKKGVENARTARKRAEPVRKPKSARTGSARPKRKSGAPAAALTQARKASFAQPGTARTQRPISSRSSLRHLRTCSRSSRRSPKAPGAFSAAIGGGHARHRRRRPFCCRHGGERSGSARRAGATALSAFVAADPRQGGADRENCIQHRCRQPPISRQSVKEFARTVGWRSMLVVPMLRKGIAIGTIGITRREAGSFDERRSIF